MLFLLVGVIYDRAHHREIDGFGGLASIMPLYTGVTGVRLLRRAGAARASRPSSPRCWCSSARWQRYPALTVVARERRRPDRRLHALDAAARCTSGKPNEKYADLPEINGRELFTLVPLAVIVLVLGVYPTPILDLQSPSLVRLTESVKAAAATAGRPRRRASRMR